MKTIQKLGTALMLAFLVGACGPKDTQSVDDVISSKDISAIRAKRGEIAQQQLSISSELSKLDEAIASLNTDKKLPLVTTVEAKKNVYYHYLELQGRVETKQNIVIRPEISGILKSVRVKEGQRVSKGQLLAQIDDGGMGQQVAQLEVQAQLAKTTYERRKRLWEQNVGSEIQFLEAETNYNAQLKAIDQVKEQLAKTLIRAPFSGVIDDVITEQGSMVAPGNSEIFRIVNLSKMYVESEVPETYIASVKKGKKVELSIPAIGEEFSTKIRQVGNFINPANRSFKVEIDVPNKSGNVKPNLTVKVKINDYTNESAILIPQSIISENAEGDQYVYVTNNKKGDLAIAKRTIVQTGKTQDDLIEVLDGIKDGDALISEGARTVKDGQEVKILN